MPALGTRLYQLQTILDARGHALLKGRKALRPNNQPNPAPKNASTLPNDKTHGR